MRIDRQVRLVLILCVLVVVSAPGCGGAKKPSSTSHRDALIATRATLAWQEAVNTYAHWLEYCGAHMGPFRNVLAACMREPRSNYRKAEIQALRSLSHRLPNARCREAAETLRSDIRDVSKIQDGVIKAFDRAHNAAVAGSDYRGRSLAAISREANQAASTSLARAKKARRTLGRC
jgi:hypothetical protein